MTFIIMLLFLLGLIIRIFIIFLFAQTTNYDLQSWNIVGRQTFEHQSIYPDIALLRHPYLPVALYILSIGKWLATFGLNFEIIIKTLFAFFDALIILLLLKCKDKKAAAIYAFNPVSIMITCIQGQFDSIPLFFLFLSYFSLEKKKYKQFAVWGSLAVAIKTWPAIFLIPGYIKARKWKLLVISAILPFISVAIYAVVFKTSLMDIIKPPLLYRGVYGVFGSGLIVELIIKNQLVLKIISALFLLSFLFITLITRKRKWQEQLSLLMLFFFVFSPTFGMQWIMWPLPFFLLTNRKESIGYIILSFVYLTLLYIQWFGSDRLVMFANGTGVILWLYLFLLIYRRSRQSSHALPAS